MVLREPFTTASPVIATFSFTDIADGTGVIDFFGVVSNDSTGRTQFLDQRATTTGDVNLQLTNGVATDLDLTPFNLPRDVRGTAKILFTGVSSSSDNDITFSIVHYDGTTETVLGTITTATISVVAGAVTEILLVPLTNKHFNTGDILRLKVLANATGQRLVVSESSLLRLSIPTELPI